MVYRMKEDWGSRSMSQGGLRRVSLVSRTVF